MSVRKIQTPTSEQPLITQQINLSGTPYSMLFNWNSRTDRWSVSIFLVDGTPLLTGATLVAGLDLLLTVSSDDRPGGMLVVVDDYDPTLDTIDPVSFLYLIENS